MKKWILCTLAATAVVACNEKTQAPGAAALGGISSGGGGTLPADPSSTWEIEDYIKNAKRDLRLIFRNEIFEAQRTEPYEDYAKKIYLGSPNILDVLEKTDLELLDTAPCYDSQGKEVDGSIHASKPNTICISSFRIAPKVAKELARNEVLSLIAHELSHLLGTNEKEAVDLQRNLLLMLKHFKVESETAFQLAQNSYDQASKIRLEAEGVLEKFDTLSPEERAKSFSSINSKFVGFYSMVRTLPFSFYLKPQFDYLKVQGDRLLANVWYSSSLLNTKEGKYWGEVLEEAFLTDRELTFEEFETRHFGSPEDKNTWPNEMIHRPSSDKDLKLFLQDLANYFDDQATYLWTFVYLSPPTKLLVGPWQNGTVNPWQKFEGAYEVVQNDCKIDGYNSSPVETLIGVSIARGTDGLLRFKEIGKNWYGESGLEDNSSDFVGGSTVSVEGDETSASRNAELGQLWGGTWVKRTDAFKLFAGEMIWTIQMGTKSGYTDAVGKAECTVKLKKTN